MILGAKQRNRKRLEQDDLDRWYDDVDENATPDDVFWEEIERQRLLNQLPTDNAPESTRLSGSATTMYANAVKRGGTSSSSRFGAASNRAMNAVSMGGANDNNNMMGMMIDGGGSMNPNSGGENAPVIDKKAAEGTLQEFSAFAVKDNWLDDDLVALMAADDGFQDFAKDAGDLDDQLEEWEQEDGSLTGTPWSQSDEPWDHWGDRIQKQGDGDDSEFNAEIMARLSDSMDADSEYRLDSDDEEQDRLDMEQTEAEFQKRVADITIRSRRLEKARMSPNAAEYFASLVPDEIEGYDQMWVSAVDNACFNNLMGSFRNYGVQFADNFGDWENDRVEDSIDYSIEDIASYKARQVFEITGLPCIASRTSFEIEPIPTKLLSQSGRPSTNDNPRVLSGYRFNDIGAHVDYMCEALMLFSEPTRVTRFRSCLCYYDGEMELFDYGVADIDIYFANSMRTFIPMAQAINEIMKKLQLTFGLEYQKWLRQRMDETMGAYGKARLKLRDRVLKEGKVLPNDIIDVSAFMDSKVDVNLMDECALELVCNACPRVTLICMLADALN
jgi:hypothetical protein